MRQSIKLGLFRAHMGTFFGHRPFHQQHQKREHHGQDRKHKKDIEEGQGRGLLRAQVRQTLQRQLP